MALKGKRSYGQTLIDKGGDAREPLARRRFREEVSAPPTAILNTTIYLVIVCVQL